jgi:hypothetical protein
MEEKSAMKRTTIGAIALLVGVTGAAPGYAGEVPPAPNGIEFPQGYKDWRVIGVSHRTDNNTLHIILGIDAAFEAAHDGNTRPRPDAAILGKMVLKDANHESWPAATVPGKFVHAEFMVKDQEKYAGTGGWGYAHWLGEEQTPYGKDASFVQECYGCHTPVKGNDYVFTHPVLLP